MHLRLRVLGKLFSPGRIIDRRNSRRPAIAIPACDRLEDRVVLSHFGGFHHPSFHQPVFHHQGHGGTSTSTFNAAVKTLQAEVQTIKAASGTTVGELATIRADFRTLRNDGLTVSNYSSLYSFENNLVTAKASGTTLAGNATLLTQFEAIYTGSPTTQQTTDLSAAYEALASAVTSASITSADISAIDTDYAAVLASKVSASRWSTPPATFPYYTLVTAAPVRGWL